MSEDPCLIAGTDTLRNTRGITDTAELAIYETRVSTARIVQLVRGEVTIPGCWDLQHLLDHHRHIFQDVYPWAGTARTTNLYKGAPSSAGSQRSLSSRLRSSVSWPRPTTFRAWTGPSSWLVQPICSLR